MRFSSLADQHPAEVPAVVIRFVLKPHRRGDPQVVLGIRVQALIFGVRCGHFAACDHPQRAEGEFVEDLGPGPRDRVLIVIVREGQAFQAAVKEAGLGGASVMTVAVLPLQELDALAPVGDVAQILDEHVEEVIQPLGEGVILPPPLLQILIRGEVASRALLRLGVFRRLGHGPDVPVPVLPGPPVLFGP